MIKVKTEKVKSGYPVRGAQVIRGKIKQIVFNVEIIYKYLNLNL